MNFLSVARASCSWILNLPGINQLSVFICTKCIAYTYLTKKRSNIGCRGIGVRDSPSCFPADLIDRYFENSCLILMGSNLF